jgi:hypothetical protein
MRSIVRDGDLPGLVQTDRPRRRRRQIDMPAPHKGTAIVDPHDHASTVANPNERSKRQGAVSRRHCRTVEMFTVGGATAAQTITTAIDACNFRTRKLTAANEQRNPQKQFHIVREHIPTPRFSNLQSEKASTASPNRLNHPKLVCN